MRTLRNLTGALLFCVVLSALQAGAAMVVSDVVLDLRSDERWRDVEVWNSGSEVLYIQVEVSEVLVRFCGVLLRDQRHAVDPIPQDRRLAHDHP